MTAGALMGVFVLILTVIAWGLRAVIRSSNQTAAQLEARRWLSEREAGISSEDRRWRTLAIRWASWIPTLTVLLVFLFLPEAWGVVSHLLKPRAGELNEFQISIPITWTITYNFADTVTGSSYATGLAGRGIALEPRRYIRADLPLSSWTVGTERYSQWSEPDSAWWTPPGDQVIATHVVGTGNARLVCMEYRPTFWKQLHIPDDPQSARITCRGQSRLYAKFAGERFDVPAFYDMLDNISYSSDVPPLGPPFRR